MRDIHILKTKDISLVAMEKPVTIVKDLAVLFIPKEYDKNRIIINNFLCAERVSRNSIK